MAGRLHSRLFFHGVIARTAVLDELILQTVNRDGARCVVNLGAGLDTRPYRLALPADLRWVEADLPKVIEYKRKLLDGEQPRCQLERFSLDVTDAAARRVFLDRVPAGLSTLLISEGLLTYLRSDEVAELARDLATPAAVEWWVLDFVGSPGLLAWVNRFPRRRVSTEASLLFASPEGANVFRPWGWDPVEVRSSWLEQRRLGREPWPMHAAWVASPPRLRQRLARITLFVLLKRRERT
jgi:methyltransferase (TIGR00027 family)